MPTNSSVCPNLSVGNLSEPAYRRRSEPRLHGGWLGHADARQVFDLPDEPLFLFRSLTCRLLRSWTTKSSADFPASQRLAAHRSG
jgi:hypothetical protein